MTLSEEEWGAVHKVFDDDGSEDERRKAFAVLGFTEADAERRLHERTMDKAADAVQPWLLDAAELLSRGDPGPTPWLVESLIVDRALTAVVGRWKTTKSYGVLDICIAIATGRDAFGVFSVPDPGPVVFVNEESGEAALWRRLDALCRGRAIPTDELRGRLYVAANKRVKLDNEEWQAEILAQGLHLQPRLFVFDPLARVKAASRKENEQFDMAPLIEFMRTLRSETGAGVLFVHHTGHQGEHMRGSSDLESAWETRLRWKRDGQASEVTIESEHREAEAAAPFKYRIAWDGLTRSMRFEAVDDPFTEWAHKYVTENPEASANDVYKAAEGRDDRPRKTAVLELVKTLRQGGSETGNHPGTTRTEQRQGSGSHGGAFRPPGTTLTVDPLEVVPKPGTTRSESERPGVGEDGYLERTFGAFEAELITEGEWRQAEGAHRFVKAAAQ